MFVSNPSSWNSVGRYNTSKQINGKGRKIPALFSLTTAISTRWCSSIFSLDAKQLCVSAVSLSPYLSCDSEFWMCARPYCTDADSTDMYTVGRTCLSCSVDWTRIVNFAFYILMQMNTWWLHNLLPVFGVCHIRGCCLFECHSTFFFPGLSLLICMIAL